MSMLNRPPHLSSPNGGGEGPFVHAASQDRSATTLPLHPKRGQEPRNLGRSVVFLPPPAQQSGTSTVRAVLPPTAKRGGGPRRGALFLAAVLALSTAFAPIPARAQIPVTDVAHIAQSIAHYFARAYEIYQKGVQIKNQIDSIKRQIQALKKLENPNWREVASLLYVLDRLMEQGQALAYSLADIDAQFRTTFPGWAEYANPVAERRRQVERALDTMRAGLGSVNRSSRLIVDQYTLGDIKKTMAGVKGHQEALELLATIGTFAAEEQILTRQALAVQNNLDAVYYAYRLNQEAQGAATAQATIQKSLAASRAVRSPGFRFSEVGARP